MRTKSQLERGADERQPHYWYFAIGTEFELLSLIGTPIGFKEAPVDAIKDYDGSGWPVWFRPILLLEAINILRVCSIEGGRNKTGRGDVEEV